MSHLLGGQVTHRDSLGTPPPIRPGEVNWMTGGRGITHSERFSHPDSYADGGLDLMQLWAALPEADEECEPAFTHCPASALPGLASDGVWMRLLAGCAYGDSCPVRTHSPQCCLHTGWLPGAHKNLPGGHGERAVYLARGEVEHAGEVYQPGQPLVFGDDLDAVITARTPATLMLFGGEPLGERHIVWNFVSSRPDHIELAKADWPAGRFALPPDDDREWIPLP